MNNKKNILLIGLMGCGKTTIGRTLAKRIKYNYIDMDEYIEKISGETIPNLFKVSEENFRDWETEACNRLSKEENTVISSGGGVIKREINMDFFKNNTTVIFIDRDVENIISNIDITKRPLLSNGKEVLYNLKEERYGLYNKYCDYRVENNGAFNEVVEKIIDIVNN